MKRFLILSVSFALFVNASANDITLAWSPATDVSVLGYKIYYAQVGQSLTNSMLVGNTNMATVWGLTSATNITYWFTCVATNGAVESLPTMQISTVIPPHAVNHPRFVGRTGSAFTLTWDASDEVDAKTYKVTYGVLNPRTTNVVTVVAPATLATVSSGLTMGALHYFDFTVVNNAGVESWPKYQLRDTLLPAGPADLKVSVQVQ